MFLLPAAVRHLLGVRFTYYILISILKQKFHQTVLTRIFFFLMFDQSNWSFRLLLSGDPQFENTFRTILCCIIPGQKGL